MQVKNSIRREAKPTHAWSAENVWHFLDVFLPAPTVYYVVRPAVVIMLIVGLMFGGWVTTVSASYNSLPGEYLYAVKIATEAVRVAVAPKPVETKLHAEFAVRRAQEVSRIISNVESSPEKVKKVEDTVKSLQKELDSAKGGLKDLKENGSKSDAAQVAKVVGEKAVEVQRVIEQTKNQIAPANTPVVVVTPATAAAAKDALAAMNKELATATKDAASIGANADTVAGANTSIGANNNSINTPVKEISAIKESLKSAGVSADDASTKAIQVLVYAHKEDNQSVSSEDVKSAVDKKIQSMEEKMQTVNSQLQSIVATSTPATSATAINRAETKILEKAVEKVVDPVKQTTENAKSTLQEAKDLSQNQNFDGALDKLQKAKDIVKAAEVSMEKIQIVGATSTFAGIGVVEVKVEGKDAGAKSDGAKQYILKKLVKSNTFRGTRKMRDLDVFAILFRNYAE